jgi:hypothetical protein
VNVEIGAEAALFPEKEYIKGIFVAVQWDSLHSGKVYTEGRLWCVSMDSVVSR